MVRTKVLLKTSFQQMLHPLIVSARCQYFAIKHLYLTRIPFTGQKQLQSSPNSPHWWVNPKPSDISQTYLQKSSHLLEQTPYILSHILQQSNYSLSFLTRGRLFSSEANSTNYQPQPEGTPSGPSWTNPSLERVRCASAAAEEEAGVDSADSCNSSPP